MKFITNIEKEKFDDFVIKSGKPHFLQSYNWGQFAKIEKNLIPHYVGLQDKNKLIATAMILEKKLPFNTCYFYIPRGFVLDYNNTELLSIFTKELKEYAKKKNCVFIKIDPDLIYNKWDKDSNRLINEDNSIYNKLRKLGYKHTGFTKNFETMQPRYTFRIDFNKDYSLIEDGFSKTTKQRIKKADELGVDVRIGDIKDIKIFYDLMLITENRKGFVTHNESYYRTLYEIFSKDNLCNLFIGSVDLDKILKRLKEKKTSLILEMDSFPKDNLSKSAKSRKAEVEKQISHINEEITSYTNYSKEYGNNINLSAHFIIQYGDMAWVLDAGNHNILTDTYTNYLTYKKHIKYYYDKGIKIYDQFGTIGDLRKDNPLLGLHEFKKKFGGDYVEFTGEYDLVLKKFFYFAFTKLVPLYRNFIKKRAKKRCDK